MLQPSYLKSTSNSDEWEKLAIKFENEWSFSNCIGAINGKTCVY